MCRYRRLRTNSGQNPYRGCTGYLSDGEGNRIAKGALISVSLPLISQACNLASNGFKNSFRHAVDAANWRTKTLFEL